MQIKNLIDEYAANERVLKENIEALLNIIRQITLIHANDKGEVRLSKSGANKAEGYGLEIKQLKNQIVLKVKEKEASND